MGEEAYGKHGELTGNSDVCFRTDQLDKRRIGPCDIGAIRFLDGADRKREENDHQHEEDLGAAVQ